MAEKQGTPLTSIDGFSEAAANQLAELWITSAEELVSTAKEVGGVESLAGYLGLTEAQVTELVDLAVDVLPDDVSFGPEDVMERGLGAMDEPEGQDPDAEPVSFGPPLPATISLVDRMPAVRNQRNRGTCVAHACVAVREYLLGNESTSGDLSEQFTYWACKQRDGYDGEGTWIKYGMAVLKEQGVCVESVWPYVPDPIPGNEGQGPPPQDAEKVASNYTVESHAAVEPRWTLSLREVLSQEQPIAFAVPVYRYWLTEPVRSSGDIRMPMSHDKKLGGHAMCIVGYEDDPEVPGGGAFLIRNSWGTDWAGNSAVAAGYARLPYAYMEQYGRSAYTAYVPAAPPAPTPPAPNPGPSPEPQEPDPKVEDSWFQRLLKRLGLA